MYERFRDVLKYCQPNFHRPKLMPVFFLLKRNLILYRRKMSMYTTCNVITRRYQPNINVTIGLPYSGKLCPVIDSTNFIPPEKEIPSKLCKVIGEIIFLKQINTTAVQNIISRRIITVSSSQVTVLLRLVSGKYGQSYTFFSQLSILSTIGK